jgi:folate-binding protein YgfZ
MSARVTTQTTPLVCALDRAAVIRIEGDDAATWLQGQTTQDVHALREGEGAYTLFVLPTGKVRNDAYMSRRGQAIDVVVDAEIRDALADVLERYVVMEDVTISKPAIAVLTVQDASRSVAEGFDARSASRLGGEGYDVFVPSDAREGALETLAGRARLLTAEDFERLRIERGMPRFGVDFGADTLPQEAGVARRAVSFTKGCYIGQEPIVMLEHRGKPPKRLCVVKGAGAAPSVPAPLAGESGVVGQLTSVTSQGEGFVGLALIKRSAAQLGASLASGSTQVMIVSHVGDTTADIAPEVG